MRLILRDRSLTIKGPIVNANPASNNQAKRLILSLFMFYCKTKQNTSTDIQHKSPRNTTIEATQTDTTCMARKTQNDSKECFVVPLN